MEKEKIRLNVDICKEDHAKLKKVAEEYFLNVSDLIRLIARNAEKFNLNIQLDMSNNKG